MPNRASPKRKRPINLEIGPQSKAVHLEISSNSSALDVIRRGFYLDPPDELASFYQFCTDIDPENPLGVLVDSLQLRLVGPFELLHKCPPTPVELGRFVLCYRYFHDPPELITLLVANNGLHFGYFRDKPNEKPSLVAKGDRCCGELTVYAPTLFITIKSLLSSKATPAARTLLDKLLDFAKKHNINMEDKENVKKNRQKICVCPTLNNLGLFIQLKEGDVGYRPLSVSNAKLTALLKAVATASTEEAQLAKLEPVDQLVTYAQFACDEGDYGQSLELGLSMLAFSLKDSKPEQLSVFNSRIKHLLSVGYELAGRSEYGHVILEHMKNRTVDPIEMPSYDL